MSSDNPTGADDQQETASAVDGVERVARLAYSRNAVGEQRSRSLETVLAGSSETARQAPPVPVAKVQSDPHGDMGSQAEMT